MKLKNFLKLESKRVCHRQYLIIFLIFAFLAGYFLQSGINRYKRIVDEKKHFQEYESTLVQRIVYIPQYGYYGVRILFVPSPFIVFFDAGPIPINMTASIDSSERLLFYQPLKGENTLPRIASIYFNFSGFTLLFGTILAMIYGFLAFRNNQWLRAIDCISPNRWNIFLYILISRAIILLSGCLLIAIESAIILKINQLSLLSGSIAILFLVIYFLLLCFLSIGLIASSIKNKFSCGLILLTSWFLLSFLLPQLLFQWTYHRTGGIGSIYQIEILEQDIFLNYEKSGLTEGGKFNESKRGILNEIHMFLKFWDTGYKKIMGYEEKMLNAVKEQGTFFQTIAGFCPSTFFLSVNTELSSSGFNNLVAFQEYSQQMKKDFIWFIASMYILSNRKEIIPFIVDDKNIFQGKSMVPTNFAFGMAMNMIWLIVFTYCAWKTFNRSLKYLPVVIVEDEGKELTPGEFKHDTVTIVMTSDKRRLSQLVSHLREQKTGFVSVPDPDTLPGDVRIKDILEFFGLPVPEKIQPIASQYGIMLGREYKAWVLLEITRSLLATGFLIFDNFLTGLPDQFVDYFAASLEEIKKGKKVAYFSNNLSITAKIGVEIIQFPGERLFF